MGAERGHSCYPLELQPGRTPGVQPVQVLILDQLTTQSPLTYCTEGRYVKLFLSLYSFSTFSESFKFGLCWLWWKYIFKSITFDIPIGVYGYLVVYFCIQPEFLPVINGHTQRLPAVRAVRLHHTTSSVVPQQLFCVSLQCQVTQMGIPVHLLNSLSSDAFMVLHSLFVKEVLRKEWE